VNDLAPAVLRLFVGIVVAYHGWEKVRGGIAGFGGFLDSLGVPFPGLMAYVVTFLELGGGVLLILGFLTRVWALMIAVEMIFTTLLVKLDVGLIGEGGAGAELDILIFAGCVVVLLLGPGRLSLDWAVRIEPLGRRFARA